jgi:hypothetical protein
MNPIRWAALMSLLVITAALASPPDPIGGKRHGKAGFPQDRIEIGLEIKANEKGEMKAYLYEPVGNFYGLELPGPVVRDGDTDTVKESALRLRVNGTRLERTHFPLNAPIELHRTEILPIEAPIPDLPPGPGPKWVANLGGSIFAPAAARDGVAYVGSTAGLFHAVGAADGSSSGPSWREAHPRRGARDRFACLLRLRQRVPLQVQRATGKEVWRYDLGDGRVARPILHQVLDK